MPERVVPTVVELLWPTLQSVKEIGGSGTIDEINERVNAYRRRRDRVLEVIPDGICQGTFFVWFPLPDGWTAERILEELRVAVAPGEGFGSHGAGWARLSLAVTDETLELGLERLARLAGDS